MFSLSRSPIVLLALLAGTAVGLLLADTDQVFFFLTHRSIVTHGLVLPLLAYQFIPTRSAWFKAGFGGLCLAMAVHLSFDLFPRGWYGYALLHIPFINTRLEQTYTVLWFLTSMVACCNLSFRVLSSRMELAAAVIIALVGFSFAAQRESTFWVPLLVLVFAFFTAACLPNPLIKGQRVLRYFLRNRSQQAA